MAILIIGAGLVGSQIARILVDQGETPVLMDRAAQPKALGEIVDLARVELDQGDVLRPFSLAEVMRRHEITEIIHLAANPMLTIGAQRDPYAAIELNIMGTTNVLEAARVHGVKRVVVASSGVLNHHLAGGEGKGDPMHEEAFPRPVSFYASCKQAVESIGLNYARWCGVEFAAMRYAAVAGPWGGEGGGAPSNVFLAMVRAALAGEEAVLPASTMEWVYSKDAARATLLAARASTLKNRVFNASMGRLTSPQDLAAALIAAVPGARYRIEKPAAGPTLQGMSGTSNLSLARELLGFVPEYQMGDAVRDTVAWFRGRRS
ncbi:MAG: hypothetical protein A3G27_14315 [Betaproteobacteria bacterium RIFCSPLOWO2_12_FULL_66_14]|nr:MAG: hypothetical protein A3G27_14315 [Betaproteobacteria bacterium RIFCSPLOWO2_12_FULL_66_14]